MSKVDSSIRQNIQSHDIMPKTTKQSKNSALQEPTAFTPKTQNVLEDLKSLRDSLIAHKNVQQQNYEAETEDTHPSIRTDLIGRVAKEYYDNILFTDVDNALVKDIHHELSKDTYEQFIFKHEVNSNDVKIYREAIPKPVEITGDEKTKILDKLWNITLDKVEHSMTDPSSIKETAMTIKKTSSSSSSISSSIQSTKAYGAVNSASKSEPVSSAAQTGDVIEVSSEGILRTEAFRSAMSASEVRQEKVRAIKEKLANGQYFIDTKQLALNILKNEAELLF